MLDLFVSLCTKREAVSFTGHLCIRHHQRLYKYGHLSIPSIQEGGFDFSPFAYKETMPLSHPK